MKEGQTQLLGEEETAGYNFDLIKLIYNFLITSSILRLILPLISLEIRVCCVPVLYGFLILNTVRFQHMSVICFCKTWKNKRHVRNFS